MLFYNTIIIIIICLKFLVWFKTNWVILKLGILLFNILINFGIAKNLISREPLRVLPVLIAVPPFFYSRNPPLW